VPSGSGRPLPQAERRHFEAGFGADFSRVRVHTGPQASAIARASGARAFALGHDLVFGAGEYAPATARGQHVLAHELGHVAQYRPGAGRSPSEAAEADAARAARHVMTGRRADVGVRHGGQQPLYLTLGEPQHLPDRTYIAGQQPRNDGFLQSAVDYHETWGLRPQVVQSLHEILTDLAGDQGTLSRVRIVTHASQTNLYMPMFASGPSGILEDDLRAYAQGGVAGLAESILNEFRVADPAALRTDLLTELRQHAPQALQPFGLETRGQPTGDFREFFDTAGLIYALQGMQAQAPPAQQSSFTNLIAATDTVLDARTGVVLAAFPQAAEADVQALRAAIAALPATIGFQVQTHTFNGLPLGSKSAVATPAVQGTFDADLAGARARLGTSSWVDIRGCQVGQSPSYMGTIADFFGRGDARPHVSAPNWYQSFPTLGYSSLPDSAIASRAGRDDVRAALDYWSPLVGVRDILHWQIQFFLSVLFAENARELAELEASSRRGVPTLRGGLELPRLTRPGIFPGLPTLGLPPSVMFPPPLRREPTEPSPPSLGLEVPPLTSTLRPWAEAELDRLMADDAELRLYLESALVLPVRMGGAPSNVRLYVKQDLEQQALENWLGSQWDTAAPGLESLQQGHFRDEGPRRVAMVSEADPLEVPDAERFFSPDPRYHAHIVER
jgi:hypothetical protein